MSGDLDIIITTSSGSASETFDVKELGSVKYVHDVPDSSESDSGAIQSILGTVEITCFDKLDSGNSFFDDLIAETTEAFVKWNYTDRSGTNYYSAFAINPQNVKYKAPDDLVTIKLTNIPKNLFVGDGTYPSVNDVISAFNFNDPAITTIDFAPVYDLIEGGLNELPNQIPNADATYISTNLTADIDVVRRSKTDARKTFVDYPALTAAVGDTEWFIGQNSAADSAFKAFARLAAANGCFFGFGMGRIWFTHRLSTADVSSLTYDDISLLENKYRIRAFDTVSVFSNGSTEDGVVLYGSVSATGTEITDGKSFSYIGNVNDAGPAKVTSTTSGVQIDFDTSGTDQTALAESFVNNGFDAYWVVKGHTPTASFIQSLTIDFEPAQVIEFEILGMTKLLPNQAFSFDSSVPSQFRSRTYRPTEVEYDYEADKVKGRAYRIA
jgi:hypothetical protein